jgi:hypothetical protein
MHRQTKRFRRLFKTNTGRLTGLAVAIVIVLAVLELTNVIHLLHKSPLPPVIPVDTSQAGKTDSSQPTAVQPSPPPSDKTTGNIGSTKSESGSTAEPDNNLALKPPFGSFVSNHDPGANGSPTREESVCITTPGATCYIKFTNGTSTTKLPQKITNDEGVASWSWDVKDANFTKGEWKITAVATLSGKSKTSEDQRPLTIK